MTKFEFAGSETLRTVPFGYVVRDRKLVIHEEQAATLDTAEKLGVSTATEAIKQAMGG